MVYFVPTVLNIELLTQNLHENIACMSLRLSGRLDRDQITE